MTDEMATEQPTEADWEYERRIRNAFSPTAPINQRTLFAGRAEQMLELISSVDEPGQHVILYGERGVGKTSLASVASDVLSNEALTVRVNCQTTDTFSALWMRAFKEIQLQQQVSGAGFNAPQTTVGVSLPEALGLPEEVTADHVRATLTMLARTQHVVVIFDEFDRVVKVDVHQEFADCIKTLSDQIVPATIVIVGVADDVNELIQEHASVERALAQISMPRMSSDELQEIVVKGLDSVGMTVEPTALGRITKLSQGLPHYTHLLAQQAALEAAEDGRRLVVTTADTDIAMERALKKTQESIAALYYRATYSARENLYKQVLLACANAQADDRGYFSASAVRESLSAILGRRMEIPQFAMHLNAFAGERGPVLKKEGAQRKFRYRFINPLLQPYVLMRGVKDGLLDTTALDD